MEHLLFALIGVAALILSLSLHEFSHAAVALYLGDETAKRMGRLTLNPVPHIDPIGTLLLPILGSLSGLPMIGWAKPVPVNPYNLRHGKWGETAVALAGPISNFLSAFFFIACIKLATAAGLGASNLLIVFLFLLVMINVVLGLFNFLPIHPLDGAKLINAIFDAPKYQRMRMFLEVNGPMILLGVIILDFVSPVPLLGSLFSTVLGGIVRVSGLDQIPGLF